MSKISEFAVEILKQYAKENSELLRTTTDTSPLEQWLIIQLYKANQAEPQVSLDSKLVQARKEKKEKFEKMIRDYTNNLLFGDQSQVMTYMLNFTNKLWDFVKKNNLSN